MTQNAEPAREEMVGWDEASRLLEVAPSRIQTMVEEDMLSPIETRDGTVFRRAEVMAVRELGA